MKKKLFSEIPFIQGEGISLHKITQEDAPALKEMVDNPRVYRFLPTFLFEKKYEDITYVIRHLYDECFQESIILGIYTEDGFCGIAELYGFKDKIHKVSVGCRLMERYWGRKIATKALGLMVRYLAEETDIEIITASIMVENQASARAAQNNGFTLVVHAAEEDWGRGAPTIVDKWIR